MVVIVKLVRVEAEELEQEHGNAVLVLAAEPGTQLLQVVAELALGSILSCRLFLLTCVECREDRGLPQLEEGDNQAYPCIRTQSAAKGCAGKVSIAQATRVGRDGSVSPASLRILLRVQYLMIMASCRTRSSMPTYVRTIRVFSRAGVLLMFISQARFKSGSQILTIGTLAEDTHTTFSIPSTHGQYHPQAQELARLILLSRSSAIMQTDTGSFPGVVMQMSTSSR